MRLKTKQLDIGYEQTRIVEDLNIAIPDGRITALVGANGSGKSTILKTMARLLKPTQGEVLLDGKAIHHSNTKDLAKQIAILPQSPQAPDGLSVFELVSYGRNPYRKGLGNLTQEDKQIISWALDVTGTSDFHNKSIDQLSGGQRQKAWIAMALAQGTDILFLDEPTTYLDMAHQLEVLMLLERLNKEQHRTIIMVVHDLNHASRFAQHMIAIKKGSVIAQGTPREVMTKEMLKEVFHVDADIIEDPRHHIPICLPQELALE